jgi:hypothetical protein
MSLTETKAARFRLIEDLLLVHPEGLTQAEFARSLEATARLSIVICQICRSRSILMKWMDSAGRSTVRHTW